MFVVGVGRAALYIGAVETFVHGVYELSLDDIEYPVYIISRSN
jgi:hypothetical protein